MIRIKTIYRIINENMRSIIYCVQNRYPSGGWPFPVAAVSVQPHGTSETHPVSATSVKEALNELFDGIFWKAVPKKRRSHERNMLRRHGWTYMDKYCTPKRGIVACPTCGQWHLKHTLCGNCYARVREETERLKASVDYDTFYHNAPQHELRFVYPDQRPKSGESAAQGESTSQAGERALDEKPSNVPGVINVDHERPTWWPSNLLTKGNTS